MRIRPCPNPPPQPVEPAELQLTLCEWQLTALRVGSAWMDIPGNHRLEILRLAHEMAEMLRRLR